VMSLVLLNIAGGDSVDDLRILEKDEGLVKVVRQLGFPAIPARSGGSRKGGGGRSANELFLRLR